MRRFQYKIPAKADTPEICLSQSVTTNLTLNGSLADQTTSSVQFNGYSRSLSIILEREDDVPLDVTFTITGTQNGVTIVEQIRFNLGGSRRGEVGTLVFDTISSITSDIGVRGPWLVEVTAGDVAYFPLIAPDLALGTLDASFRIVSNQSFAPRADPEGKNFITVYSSFLNRYRNGLTFQDQETSDELVEVDLTGAGGRVATAHETIAFNYLIKIEEIDSSVGAASEFSLVFLQAGNSG